MSANVLNKEDGITYELLHPDYLFSIVPVVGGPLKGSFAIHCEPKRKGGYLFTSYSSYGEAREVMERIASSDFDETSFRVNFSSQSNPLKVRSNG